MNEFARIHKRQLILGLLIATLFVGFKVLKYQKPAGTDLAPPGTEKTEVTERNAAVVSFGDWAPSEYRTVLGQVVSDSDINVKAELNGTIARVNVVVGDKVYAGQALASYKTSGDPTAINYQSALSSLQTTKLSGQNSVRSSEIGVENAQKSLAQTIAQQDQTYAQAYESLRLEEQSVGTLITSALDTIDKHVQFTAKYKYNQSLAYFQLGNTDTIRKQQVKTAGQQTAVGVQALVGTPVKATETQILQQANARLRILKSLQTTYDSLEILIERTAINTRVSETELNGFLAAIEGVHAALDAKVSAYQAQIDGAKSVRESTRLGVLGAQNALESAKSGLELAKSQAEAQVIGAQNQVNIAGASTADLTVRAPISGTITAKNVRVGDLVSPGTELFTVVNEAQDKKVVAYLNQDEWNQAKRVKEIEIEINGKVILVTQIFLSSQLDSQTQKVLAEFTIPAAATLVGNLATVRIPLGSLVEGESNLLPFSAVSFEPDGAEVLVLDENNIAQRQKVVVGRVVVSNIEIVSGLGSDIRVVEFYKRVFPGEKINDGAEAVVVEKDITSDDILTEEIELELNLDVSDE